MQIIVLQTLSMLWVHWRADDALALALLHSRGAGCLDEALPKRARGVALMLLLMFPACWGW
jgi:hypothetical protein